MKYLVLDNYEKDYVRVIDFNELKETCIERLKNQLYDTQFDLTESQFKEYIEKIIALSKSYDEEDFLKEEREWDYQTINLTKVINQLEGLSTYFKDIKHETSSAQIDVTKVIIESLLK